MDLDLLVRHLSLSASHAEAALTASNERATMLQEELDALVVETDFTRQRNRRLVSELEAAKQGQREASIKEQQERQGAQQRVAEAEARAHAAISLAHRKEERVRVVLAALKGLGLGLDDVGLEMGLEQGLDPEDRQGAKHGSESGK